MDSARKLYLDNIRWMTVVLVVIYHVVYMFNGVQPFGVIGPFREHQLQDCFQYLVYPWFMALLFVVSGMSARYYLQSHTTKQFLKDKTRKLLVPSTIGLFVFQWLLGIYNLKIGGGLNIAGLPMPILYLITVLSGVGPLWYIQMLWLFSMLLLVVRKIEKDRVWNFCSKAPVWSVLMLTIIVYGSAQVLNTPIVTVYRFGIYGFCFFAGYFLFSHEEVMERLCKWWWMFDAASAVLGISYTVRYFGENYAIAPVLNNIHACVYCWFAILGILTTMKNYADISTAFTHWMAKKSWGLYIFHYLPIENGYNYTGIAQKHKVGYQQIYTWVQKYKKDGEEGLKDRRGRHKKDYKPQTKEERLKLEVATLKRQLYLSQMEIDVLKKLQELERGNR